MGKRSSARFLVVVFGVISLFLLFHGNVAAEDDKRGLGQTPAPEQQAQRPTLVQAAICEKVENLNPVTQSMVFRFLPVKSVASRHSIPFLKLP